MLPPPYMINTPAPDAFWPPFELVSAPEYQQFCRTRACSNATASTYHSYQTAHTHLSHGERHHFRQGAELSPTLSRAGTEHSFETAKADWNQIPPRDYCRDFILPLMQPCCEHPANDCCCFHVRRDSGIALDALANGVAPQHYETYQYQPTSTAITSAPRIIDCNIDLSRFGVDKNGKKLSKAWNGDSEKLRVQFAHMKQNARDCNLDRSPFLPKTLNEYAKVHAEIKSSHQERLKKKTQGNEGHDREHRDVEETVATAHQAQPRVQKSLLQRKMEDGLSAVFAVESCFGENPSKASEDDQWPPVAHYRSWKASRPASPRELRRRNEVYYSIWPLPRESASNPASSSPHVDEVPYDDRKFASQARRDWKLDNNYAISMPDDSQYPIAEISVYDLHLMNMSLGKLIAEIDRFDPQ